MSTKELQLMEEYLLKQWEEVRTSRKAGKKLLMGLGLMTPKGNFRKSFRPSKLRP